MTLYHFLNIRLNVAAMTILWRTIADEVDVLATNCLANHDIEICIHRRIVHALLVEPWLVLFNRFLAGVHLVKRRGVFHVAVGIPHRRTATTIDVVGRGLVVMLVDDFNHG